MRRGRKSSLEGSWPEGLGSIPGSNGAPSNWHHSGVALLPAYREEYNGGGDTPNLRAIYDSFDASQPVQDAAGLYGRGEQLSHLVSGVLYRKNHAVVSGPRGSGKTSIVKVFGERAESEGVVVLYLANDADSPFGLTMRRLLERIPGSSLQPGDAEDFQAQVRALDAHSSAQQVVSLLARIVYSMVVLVLDEFDRVPDQGFKSQISSLMKLSSDDRLRARLILVGDERTFPDVLEEHPSLSRHTTHVSTAPLSAPAINELLEICAQRAGMTFSKEGRQIIADAVCGSPYHARLFGLHAALRAEEADSPEVRREDAVLGLGDAFDEWASLNPEAAGLFRDLVASGAVDKTVVGAAVRIAWRVGAPALNGSSGSELESQALDLLRPLLDETETGHSFKDSTAAQFLIAHYVVTNREGVTEAAEKERTYS
jgi:hypothetical protein